MPKSRVLRTNARVLTEHRHYYETKTLLFFIGDVVSTIFAAMIVDYVICKLVQINTSKKAGLFVEYSAVLLFIIPFCIFVAFCRGMVLHGEMYPMEKIFVAIILASLFTCLFYAFRKHKIEQEKRQILLAQQAELKHEKLQTELQALRSQYHPHFLFNALNTIYFLIDHNNKKAREAVELLSEILRYQVKCGGDKVPLQDEIDYIKKDIEMRKLRSSNLLKLNLEIDYNADNEQVYPLLFTPIIENAFKYIGGEYILDISLVIKDNVLTLTVINSLPDDYDSSERNDGTGLANLHRRLNILYPEKHLLECLKDKDIYKAKLKIDLL